MDETASLRAQVEALQEEAAFLRALLGEQEEAARVEALRKHYKIRNIPARVLERLFIARGGIVSHATLLDVFAEPDRAALGNDLAMAVSYIRNALRLVSDGSRPMVEIVAGRGYRLTPTAMARVRRVVARIPHRDQQPSGRRPRCDRKLTDDQVRAIRSYPAGQRPTAECFGISQGMVCYIRNRKQYADVPDVAPADARRKAA